MTIDLGLQGAGILLAVSLGFGLVAQLLFGRLTTRWLWIISALSCFVAGLFASEVLFAGMTEDDIQPIIDGLAFDEALLFVMLAGSLSVVVTWLATRQRRIHHPSPL